MTSNNPRHAKPFGGYPQTQRPLASLPPRPDTSEPTSHMRSRKEQEFGNRRSRRSSKAQANDKNQPNSYPGPQPPSSDFTFQASHVQGRPAPRFPREPIPLPPRPQTNRDRSHQHNNNRRNGSVRNEQRPRGRVSDRPLLSGQRNPTPERFPGMNTGEARFKSIADLSDSEGEDMQLESDNDEGGSKLDQDTEHANKRIRLSPSAELNESAVEAPKWSNPDPYTALPPTDDSQAKRKDVIKLIRKAKASHQKPGASKNEGDDFISFDSVLHSAPNGPRAARLNETKPGMSQIRSLPALNASTNVTAPPPPPPPPPPRDIQAEVDAIVASNSTKPRLANIAKNYHTSALESTFQELRLPDNHSQSGNPKYPPIEGQQLDAPPPPPPPEIVEALSHASGPKLSSSLRSFSLPAKPSKAVAPRNNVDTSTNDTAISRQLSDQTIEADTNVQRPNTRNKMLKTSKKRNRDSRNVGDVTEDWVAVPDQDSIPWLQVDHSETLNMGTRLHKEICDFYAYVRPRDFEETMRRDLVDRITRFVTSQFPKAQVHVFGSFASGMYLPNADIDLVVLSASLLSGNGPSICQKPGLIHKFANALRRAEISSYEHTVPIAHARVPIVKFVDSKTGIRCDISFENTTGVVANATYQQWLVQYPALPQISCLVKQFLMMRGLNEVHTGGLGGFTITCLIICLMRHMPQLSSGNMDPMHNLGEIFMHFLDFYGNKFNTTATGIQMNPPALFSKLETRFYSAKRPEKLCVIDPNKADNDISKGSVEVQLVFKAFASAFETLQTRMHSLRHERMANNQAMDAEKNKADRSILGAILAGDYRSFDNQRAILEKLYLTRH